MWQKFRISSRGHRRLDQFPESSVLNDVFNSEEDEDACYDTMIRAVKSYLTNSLTANTHPNYFVVLFLNATLMLQPTIVIGLDTVVNRHRTLSIAFCKHFNDADQSLSSSFERSSFSLELDFVSSRSLLLQYQPAGFQTSTQFKTPTLTLWGLITSTPLIYLSRINFRRPNEEGRLYNTHSAYTTAIDCPLSSSTSLVH